LTVTDSGRHADRRPRWFLGLLLGAGIATALAAAASAVLAVVMARIVLTPPRARRQDVAIISVNRAKSTITVEATADTVVPGRYGFWFSSDTGHVRLGEIVAQSAGTVTRRILGVDRGTLPHAGRGRISGWFYLSPKDLRLDYESVEIPTALGLAPAWLVPAKADSDRWVIQVHGRAVTRSETLRAVPVFREAGYHSLLISYRNDGDAPPSADGRYSLGDAEWEDVESAIAFALERGARDVVLMGWSMGGATVLQALARSGLSAVVRGLVLDSPVVDWRTALDFQAKLSHLPRPVGRAAQLVMSRSWGRVLTGQSRVVDLDRLDLVRGAAGLRVPTLLLHSDDDGYVPATASHALAEARPDIVTMETFTTARHTKLWNYDSERWNGAIAVWLDKLEK
jgi:pimeloyl-ACP methyl ester carboxylesterase